MVHSMVMDVCSTNAAHHAGASIDMDRYKHGCATSLLRCVRVLACVYLCGNTFQSHVHQPLTSKAASQQHTCTVRNGSINISVCVFVGVPGSKGGQPTLTSVIVLSKVLL